MPLTDIKVRAAKPKEKDYKLADGGGLFLLVKTNGSRYWRMKYRVEGKEKLLAFGVYPDISLADARELRDEARKQKAKGFDPGELKKDQRQQASAKGKNSFELLAREWHGKQINKWSAYYSKQVMQRLEKDVFPQIGAKAMNEISARELLDMANLIQDRDAIEMAHRAVNICAQVFQYALITERAENNPALALRGALKLTKTKNYAHLSAKDLPEFLADLKNYHSSSLQTKLGIKLLLLTFVRTNELCGAQWSEIDLEKAKWRIPAERMKMKAPHIVPLSKQAVTILKMLSRLTGHLEYVLPSIQSSQKTMSTNLDISRLFTAWVIKIALQDTALGRRPPLSSMKAAYLADQFNIKSPSLTKKEVAFLNSLLPESLNTSLTPPPGDPSRYSVIAGTDLLLPTSDVRAYEQFYVQYPSFTEIQYD